MSRKSAIYEGTLWHVRRHPVEHQFSYPLQMMYLDLGELPSLFRGRWLWSVGRVNVCSFRREDYLGDPACLLDDAVRDLVEQRLGSRPAGPVRVLTHMRRLGHNFNPVSFYYCFEADEETLIATVAHVTNTPWGDRHAYVVPAAGPAVVDKALHVSPLMGMDHTYEVDAPAPGEALSVGITSRREGQTVFAATLRMSRREITGPELARSLIRHPAPTVAATARIYKQALRLRMKGAPWHPRPAEARP